MTVPFTPPPEDCDLCPRLCAFRQQNRSKFPDKFNAPVPPFGAENAELLVLGLAPGLKGANFTGRPFTADYAGVLLYSTLIRYGFAAGNYAAHADDGLQLKNCRITNSVRCVPPENKPTPQEMQTCLTFLKDELRALKNLKVIVTLGQIAHTSALRALGEKPSAFKFAHGALHKTKSGISVVNSYHCSRYNTQTKRLTDEMFHAVFDKVAALLDGTAKQ
jgi:uracil-DNA glycosylase family 4